MESANYLCVMNGVIHAIDYNFTSDVVPYGCTVIRTSTGTRINSLGFIETVASNQARFDYNPSSLAVRGLLYEGSRTNLAYGSANLTNSSFYPLGSSTVIETCSILSPDGSSYGFLLTLSQNYYNNIRTTTLPVTAGNTYTTSFYALPGTCTNVKYSVVSANNATDIIPSTSYSARLSAGKWTRISFSFTAPSGCTGVWISPSRDSASGTVNLWGIQLEAGASASSYIPTTSTAMPRTADQLSFTIPNGVGTLRYTFDDGSTQDSSVSAGAYLVPSNLNRTWIRRIQSL